MAQLRVLFTGLGSIGTRHLNNLFSILARRGEPCEVTALRRLNRPLPEELGAKIKCVGDYGELSGVYDICFVTNPTHMHYDTLLSLAGCVKNFFIEKPVFDTVKADVSKLHFAEGSVQYVACPLRHTKVMKYAAAFVKSTPVYSARAICSSYLPDWRPNADYREVYSAKKSEGGGVCIDLIHEWDYLRALFGDPVRSYNLQGKYSALEIDSEDISVYIAEYSDKLVELHLDYFGRRRERTLTLYTGECVARFDIDAGAVEFSDGRKTPELFEDVNERYVAELEYFLRLCEGKEENINPIAFALETQRLTRAEEL